MKFEKLKKLWVPMFIFGAALIIFYKTVDKLPSVISAIVDFLGIFSPIITGAIIAFILFIPQNAIEKLFKKTKETNFLNKHSRGISVGITYIALLGIIAAILYFVIPTVATSVTNLIKNIPAYYENTINYIKDLAGKDGTIWGFSVTKIEEQISLESVLSYFNSVLGNFELANINDYFNEIVKFGSGFFDFIIAVVMSVYMLCSHEQIILTGGRVLNLVFKKRSLYGFYSYVARGTKIFYDYLYGAFLDAILVGVVLAIALSIVKIPYGVLIGIFIGLCNLIPYFGAIVSGLCAVVATYITTGNLITSLIALAIILVIQQLDANLIQPRIVGKSVGIRPFYVLVAITIGGALFGFVGVLLSVPMAAFIKMCIVDITEAKRDRLKAQQSANTQE